MRYLLAQIGNDFHASKIAKAVDILRSQQMDRCCLE